jgi:hypothetical protein
MGVVTWIRKVQRALHRCAESLRHAEEDKRRHELPPNQPTEVRAVVSFSDETRRDSNAQAKCENATQVSIKNATWGAVVAASIYAFIAAYQGCQMKRATDASERQWRSDHVPWIGLESDTLKIGPTLINKMPNEAPYFDLTYSVKNVGTEPAIYEYEDIQIINTKDLGFPKSLDYFNKHCREQQQSLVPNPFLNMRMILPSAAVPGQTDRVYPLIDVGFKTPQHIEQLSLFFCIVYYRNDVIDGKSVETEHHSRYWFETKHEWNIGYVPIPGHPESGYLPITGVTLRRADAD